MRAIEINDVRAGDLPRRDYATLWGRPPQAVSRELGIRLIRGLYAGWDIWSLGRMYVAAPEGADALTDPAVISAGTMADLIVKISETAGGTR